MARSPSWKLAWFGALAGCSASLEQSFSRMDGGSDTIGEPRPTDNNLPTPRVPVEVVAGEEHTCARLSDGVVACWGLNDAGQLGTGDTRSRSRPAWVEGLLAAGLAAGIQTTCAWTMTGASYCWGVNRWRALGDGTTIDRQRPTRTLLASPPRAMSTTYNGSLALGQDSTVYLWGSSGLRLRGPTPQRLDQFRNVTHAASSLLGVWIVLERGEVWRWGEVGGRTLGSPEAMVIYNPTRLAGVPLVLEVAPSNCSTCVLTEDRHVWCWGDNDFGDVGDGTTEIRATPVPVAGLERVRHVRTGLCHNCALLEDDTVWCWGWSNEGRVREEPGRAILRPTRVMNLPPARSLTVGRNHDCVVTTDQEVYCWGQNDHGQLGDGTTTDRLVPRRVEGLR
ncbi:MAG: hypothetical protein HY909_13380 [Deltaproteobacteria bacterium]|nr:hypothetical protein [Deltaproteobacteria bacterium]